MSEMRKFCGWILPGLTAAEDVLGKLNEVVTLDAYRALLEGYLDRLVQTDDLRLHDRLTPKPTLDTV